MTNPSILNNIPPSPGPGLTEFRVNPEYLVLLQRLPVNIQNIISQEIEQYKSNFDNYKSINNQLAGHIDQEYELNINNDSVHQFIKDLCIEHIIRNSNNSSLSREIHELYLFKNKLDENKITPEDVTNLGLLFYERLFLTDFWVNFQKKYEYNPVHFHTGLFSFVIWHEIPYSLEDEKKLGPGIFDNSSRNENCNGKFEFILPNTEHPFASFKQLRLPVDKKWNGMICLFPSKLNHLVYPFYTSDKHRITISGNIQLKLNK